MSWPRALLSGTALKQQTDKCTLLAACLETKTTEYKTVLLNFLTKGFCPVTSHFCSGIEAIVRLLRGKTYIGHYNNSMLLRHMDRDLKDTAHCKNNMWYQPVILGAWMLLINIGRSGCIRIGERGLFLHQISKNISKIRQLSLSFLCFFIYQV